MVGFIGCAAGLAIAVLSVESSGTGQLLLIFLGFMLFNFMTRMILNAQSYLLAGEVFPTANRGKGAGFALAFTEIGAVMTAFLFPILLHDIGTQTLLFILVGTSPMGAPSPGSSASRRRAGTWIAWSIEVAEAQKRSAVTARRRQARDAS